MAEQILPQGIRFFPKNDKAPDFVLGTLVVTLDDLTQFFQDRSDLLTEYNNKKQLKLQLLRSKEGKLYAAVDTFKPQPKDTAPQQAAVVDDDLGLPF